MSDNSQPSEEKVNVPETLDTDAVTRCIAMYQASADGSLQVLQQAVELVHRLAPAQLERLPQLMDIVTRLSADPDSVSVLVLYLAAEQGPLDEALLESFPERVRAQLRWLIELRAHGAKVEATTQRRAESLRRLLLALAKDLRVVLMALCWQLLLLREGVAGPENTQQQLAEETFQLHAPLANRLGVWQLKWELEDLAFRCQQPEEYRRIARLVAERRSDREAFIREFIDRLKQLLADAGIRGDVSGRPKHIYSIWRKMQHKDLDFHQLFDVRAVRVKVAEIKDCYTVMGLCHMHWQSVPGEFDDYINNPKGNGYQSLHTAVIGPQGKAVEVQIRTDGMHEHAELGVAAHWRYKEGGPSDQAFERKVQLMRQLLDGQEGAIDDRGLLDSFDALTSEDRVYVLTPRGEVVDMARDSTVLDFAYHIHSDLGHRCRGAKVNGRIVPLNYQVKTGERIEILSSKQSKPSRDWLNPKLGYLKSPRSRNKVRHWFRREEWDQNLQGGKQQLDAELHRMNLNERSFSGILEKFNYTRLEELYVAIGVGDITTGQVVQAFMREQQESAPSLAVRKRETPNTQRASDAVRIEGVGNLLHQIARCCRPVPGDAIMGFITRGRGVSIHRADCANLLRMQTEDPERLLEVDWGREQKRHYAAGIQIAAYDRKNLQKDISVILSNEQVSVIAMRVRETGTGLQDIRLTVRIQDYEQLSTVLARISGLSNVLDAHRV